MSLSAGSKLGPYEILAPIGAGGMGEVYKARDTKLKRDVALKVLPDAFVDDEDRMLRFQREAEVLASLNHPHIAHIYGVEERALVMELVAGETLPAGVPVDTALGYAKQIAEALEYAHERGVIHRDLKPANIKVAPEGEVKLLDFGLAKAIEDPATGNDNPANSPTLTLGATRIGVILGTAAYMAPEQASGKTVDRRADIWSFGAVLFEMLTGKRAFEGESTSDTLATVLKLDPDWSALPKTTPAGIVKLIRRCLTKDRRQRLQAIGEARIAIEEAIEGKVDAPTVAAVKQPKLAWMLFALMTVIAGTTLWAWLRPTPPEPHGAVQLTATIPPLANNSPLSLAISHDGSRLAFVGGPQRELYVRMMDQPEARPIPGTENASYPRFSPDGQWISFVEASQPPKLKKVALAGGLPQVLSDIGIGGYPATQDWGWDGNILFTHGSGALMRIPATGGKAETLATPDPKKGELFYFGEQLLPGGQILTSLAFTGGVRALGSGIRVLNPKTGETKMLVESAGYGRYVPLGPGLTSGYIVHYIAGTASLMAVPFDANRLVAKGSAVPVVDGVLGYTTSPMPYLDVSDTGTLAYVAGNPNGNSQRTLVWVDRKGAEEPVPAPPQGYFAQRISPDGLNIAVEIIGGDDLFVSVYDLARGTLHRIAPDQPGLYPVWTPDGKGVIFSDRMRGLSSAPADGSSAPTSLVSREAGALFASSISHDGKTLIGYSSGNLWLLPLPEGGASAGRLQPFLDSRGQKSDPEFSPDGHWVAYQSNEAGSGEIYVVPFPGPGGKFLISTSRGSYPRWSRDGRELFYMSGDKMMVVDVKTSPAFQPGKPRVLFEGVYSGTYDVSPDGKRFLMVKPLAGATQGPANQVTVVLNWFEELRRRAPFPK
jgi:serine/threonine-protein kinase